MTQRQQLVYESASKPKEQTETGKTVYCKYAAVELVATPSTPVGLERMLCAPMKT